MTLLEFIDSSPSPYHTVATTIALLEAAGFKALDEADRWDIEPGGAYYTTRGGKTIIAWREGRKPAAETGYRIIGAHSDSPTLKLKKSVGRSEPNGELLSFDIYGSPLLHTWLDRDLELAGALYLRAGDTIRSKRVRLSEMPVRLVSLAPHLKTENRTEGVMIDRQEDLVAFFSQAGKQTPDAFYDALGEAGAFKDRSELLGYELCLADTMPSALVGADRAFVSAPRLDNLFCTYAAIRALIDTPVADYTTMAAIFDAEEIGSNTWTGARSNVADAVLMRSNQCRGGDSQDLIRAKARSILISADMAHAEHPSSSLKSATDPDNVPVLNKGLALKSSARGNYAIGHSGEAWFRHVCEREGLTLQSFMYRCDHGGGSSVGPLTTTALGICGIDVGAPMLAMHSSRELGGAHDFDLAVKAFTAAFSSPQPPQVVEG